MSKTIPETAIFCAFEDLTSFDQAEPERTLMLAILRAAIEDVRTSGKTQREAMIYLLDDDDWYIFSFVNICRSLRVCPKQLRDKLGILTVINHYTQ